MPGKQTVYPAVNAAVAELERRHPHWTRARSLDMVAGMMVELANLKRVVPPTMTSWDVAESLEIAGLAIRSRGATFVPTGRTLQIVRQIGTSYCEKKAVAHAKGSTRRGRSKPGKRASGKSKPGYSSGSKASKKKPKSSCGCRH